MICRPTFLEIKGMRGSLVFDEMKCMAYTNYCCAGITVYGDFSNIGVLSDGGNEIFLVKL
jgi:hypothetical protein